MWGCNTGENEQMAFAAGSLCSKGDKTHPARCLELKSTPPPGHGGGHGGGGGGSGNLQMWAKPQPKGATAVLIINDSPHNASAAINMSSIRHAHAAAAVTEVLDIWTGKTVGTVGAGGSFATPSFGSHDSVFYLFYPQGSGVEQDYL